MGYENKLYAIREISEITGVKPVTLRAWQRRYSLVQPQRTEKGHRLYTDEHIALIGEIQGWLSKGVPIGKVKDVLESNEPNKGEEYLASEQLDEVRAFLQALAELNKGKADSIVATVFKEYPLDVVQKQFVKPAEKALSVVKIGLRALQKGLMESIFVARLNAIIESENKAAKSGKCLFINYDSVNIHARLWALNLSESGKSLVIIDGIEDLSGLVEHEGLCAYAAIAIYSSRPLTAGQTTIVEKIKSSFSGEVLLSDLIDA
ncbi:MerR family transcriptional regulator [Vibrio europaeus]|uniref:Helix-turn-helix-type transcriptional regulator n=1 Tax=Vibrio europaeus TaxID=300876 RepID=A0A178J711_9VIBR|nr:MerR family transcriptional regulator [Vibrio europaeus]MDC5706047.1 MerR family transcriptional regulator [Vibrio europaeus]MDC5709457.1 MerR family transcriptional regulator [Vibrio europaeus]MDC5713856.1 MerR family transcriptional regulator [Vibrio europaeus]MDC5720577.1 MerR family transcriptional regulator [Vibrio europaeus]MDC5723536.1 MerR family transcriptional regulator [Vibrio europaeus]